MDWRPAGGRSLRGRIVGEADNDVLFGQLAVKHGLISSDELEEALAGQKKLRAGGTAKAVGEILIELGYLTRKQAHRLLREQQAKTGATKTIGHFEVLAKLGEGGMGAVYLAKMIGPPILGGSISGAPEELLEGPLVALKILPPRLAKDKSLLTRFQREVEVLAGLRHSNVVRAVDWGMADGLHYLAMEFVQGENAYQKVSRDGPLPEKQVAEIGIAIARALEYASQRGIVHRDVKPENILIDLSGVARLTDFGLVSLEGGGKDAALTHVGVTVGTPYYISPEQAQGETDADIRSDLYSLGATMYHLLTGDVPYEGEDAPVIMAKHIVEPVPDASERNRKVSPEMAAVVMKLMAKSRRDRYQSPAELADDLKQLLQGGKLLHARAAKARQVPAAKRLTTTRARIATAQARRHAARYYGVLLAAAAAGLVGAGLALGLLLSGQPGSSQSPAGGQPAPPMRLEPLPAYRPETASAPAPEATGVRLLRFDNDALMRRLRNHVVAHDGRPAIRVPAHDDAGRIAYRLPMIDAESGVIASADPSCRVRVYYKSLGAGSVRVYLLSTIDGRRISHPLLRQTADSSGRWSQLDLPLDAFGVMPGEFIHDLTISFEDSETAEVYVSDVRLLPSTGEDVALFDVRGEDMVAGGDWRVEGQCLYTRQPGAAIVVPYAIPNVPAALVVTLFGTAPSSAIAEAGGMRYQMALPNTSDGQTFCTPFQGPAHGELKVRLFPAEGAELGVHRIMFYRLR